MNRSIFFIIFIAGGSIFMIAGAPAAHAAANFRVANQQYEFSIDQNTLASWKGNFTLPIESNVFRPLFSPSLMIKAYITPGMRPPAGRDGRETTYSYNPAQVYQWAKRLAPTLAAEPQDPKLTISRGRATEFQPPLAGETLDSYRTALNILNALEAHADSADLVTQDVAPKINLGSLNNLGIQELIGHGVSSFAGSPYNRTVNIRVGVEKMAGVIISPGETFSFNKYLGPVEADQGFLPELVIKAEGTIPELGGGLCQVSSTTFRAAMDAGLPIVERRNHAYAVQYYAPQGTDATIYPGVVDLKFTNDTPGSILVWPHFTDKTTLIFDLYGTKDDRQITIDKPIQFDRKSDGSMKATWTRTVVKDGAMHRDVFQSVYRSPALYHKHEEFVSPPAGTTGETPTPNTIPGANGAPTDPPPAPSPPAPVDPALPVN